jgi:hypothetical protein
MANIRQPLQRIQNTRSFKNTMRSVSKVDARVASSTVWRLDNQHSSGVSHRESKGLQGRYLVLVTAWQPVHRIGTRKAGQKRLQRNRTSRGKVQATLFKSHALNVRLLSLPPSLIAGCLLHLLCAHIAECLLACCHICHILSHFNSLSHFQAVC